MSWSLCGKAIWGAVTCILQMALLDKAGLQRYLVISGIWHMWLLAPPHFVAAQGCINPGTHMHNQSTTLINRQLNHTLGTNSTQITIRHLQLCHRYRHTHSYMLVPLLCSNSYYPTTQPCPRQQPQSFHNQHRFQFRGVHRDPTDDGIDTSTHQSATFTKCLNEVFLSY